MDLVTYDAAKTKVTMVGTAGAMQYYQDVTPMEDGGSTNESDSRQ